MTSKGRAASDSSRTEEVEEDVCVCVSLVEAQKLPVCGVLSAPPTCHLLAKEAQPCPISPQGEAALGHCPRTSLGVMADTVLPVPATKSK